MQYMTISEYARHAGTTRQNVQNKLRRGTLPSVKRRRSITVVLIPVEDTEVKKCKA